jgi:phospholipid transport system transporter-binding protein
MLSLPSTLTIEQAPEALQQLQASMAQAADRALCVDASALVAFDSAALALLLQARRLTQARGWALELRDVPAPLKQLAELYGVAQLLGLQPA